MIISNAIWMDTNQTNLSVVMDGIQLSIPADAANRHYAELLKQGTSIAAYVVPAVTPQDEINRLEASIPARWVRDATLGDAYAIGKLQEVETLLSIERAKL